MVCGRYFYIADTFSGASVIVQTESRESSLLELYAEVQPVLCKDSANREQRVKLAWTLCRGVACLMQRYKTTFTFCASSVGYVVANAEISKRKELLFTF